LFVGSDGQAVRATARHLEALTPSELQALQTVRGRLARPERRQR
jgi:hypothetical protein